LLICPRPFFIAISFGKCLRGALAINKSYLPISTWFNTLALVV